MTEAKAKEKEIDIGRLPEQLKFNEAQLRRLTSKKELESWPGDKRIEADVVGDIAKILIAAFHTELKDLKIAYLFREKITSRNVVHYAKAKKADPNVRFLAEVDFIIEVNWTAWKKLTPRQKLALVDHELCHCTVETKNDGDDVPVIEHHDVEEFGAIVKRWGLWQLPLQNFSAQIDLFEKGGKK